MADVEAAMAAGEPATKGDSGNTPAGGVAYGGMSVSTQEGLDDSSLEEAEHELRQMKSAASDISNARKRGASFNTLKRDWEGQLDKLTIELDSTMNIVRERKDSFGGFEPSFLREGGGTSPPLAEPFGTSAGKDSSSSKKATVKNSNTDDDINVEYVSKEVLAKQLRRYKQSLELERKSSSEREEEQRKMEEEMMQLKLSYERKKRKTSSLKKQKKSLEGYVVKLSENVDTPVLEVPSYAEFQLQKEEVFVQPDAEDIPPPVYHPLLPLSATPGADTYWVHKGPGRQPNYQAAPTCFRCTIS